jgi:hypothetical protein
MQGESSAHGHMRTGRGRGLTASRTIQHGELLLVVPPISMVSGEDLTSVSFCQKI